MKTDGTSGAYSCPAGRQAASQSTIAGEVDCVSGGDEVGCRFSQVTPPAPITGASSTFTPSGPALRVRVAPTRDTNNPDLGDDASILGFPWGHGHRNEFSTTKEATSGVGAGYYGQNDDRYFGWSTYVPADGTYPDPTGTFSSSDPHGNIILQFHSSGNCDDGGPQLSLALARADATGTGQVERANSYIWRLAKRDTYHADSFDNPWGYITGDKTINGPGNYRIWPFNTQANTNPTTTSNVEKGRWHTFVLHVLWSVCDCVVGQPVGETCSSPHIACSGSQVPGVVELWVDGTLKYPVSSGNGSPADPANRPTLYAFPSSSTEYTAALAVAAGGLSKPNGSSVVTVTTASAHGFTTGDKISIQPSADADRATFPPPAAAFSLYTVTVTGTTTFTYSDGVTNSSGSTQTNAAAAKAGKYQFGFSCPGGTGELTGYTLGAPIPVYLKTGQYRHQRIFDATTIYHAGLWSGPTRASVDPLTRQ